MYSVYMYDDKGLQHIMLFNMYSVQYSPCTIHTVYNANEVKYMWCGIRTLLKT